MVDRTLIIDRFNSIIEDAERFSYITRASELQRDTCGKLTNLLTECKQQKAAAVTTGDEDFANLLLGFECAVRSLRSEIEMWLLLKEENPMKHGISWLVLRMQPERR